MKIGVIYNIAQDVFRGPALDLESDAEMKLIPQLIANELSRLGYDPVMIYADWRLIKNCHVNRIDLALNIAEGFENFNAHEHMVASLLDYGRIRYTGADPTNILLVRDKVLTKRIVEALGVRTPAWQLVRRPVVSNLSHLTFPLILKPVREEASIGIGYDSVVRDHDQLIRKLTILIERYEQPVLIEEYIEGREISVGVWGYESLQALPPCEFIFPEEDPLRKFRSFEYKWLGDSEEMRYPDDISTELIETMGNIAIASHQALNCRDYSRCDFRLTHSGKIFFLEHNFNPGIGPNSHGLSNTFTRVAEYGGYSYGEMLQRILEIAQRRYQDA